MVYGEGLENLCSHFWLPWVRIPPLPPRVYMLKNRFLLIFASFLVLIGIIYLLQSKASNKSVNPPVENDEYNPVIDPNNFVSKIDNKYFSLNPGTKYIYEDKQTDKTERIEVTVTKDTRVVMGVTTTVVQDKAFLGGELIEDTRDWYAQDNEGNVWYMGEEVDNYENGKIKDHNGSWEAGVDEAKPGIIMKANPQVGDTYRQEYYKGKAEDMGDVVSINEKITIPFGAFENCLKTRDWSQIEKSLGEYKYYCPAVGFVVLEESAQGGSEKVELISVSAQQ